MKTATVYIPEGISIYSLFERCLPGATLRIGGIKRVVIYWYDKRGHRESLGSMGNDRVFRFTRLGVFLFASLSSYIENDKNEEIPTNEEARSTLMQKALSIAANIDQALYPEKAMGLLIVVYKKRLDVMSPQTIFNKIYDLCMKNGHEPSGNDIVNVINSYTAS